MANPQDLEKLCQGPKVWNAWRAENSERIPDLRGARLTLGQRQFGANHGGPVDLNRTDLEGAELRHATLVGANLQYARLVAVDLVHAQLDHADLAGADLTDAVLDYADLADADLDGAILIGASFANVRGLTQDQIEAAHGDASTILPPMLVAPETWFPPLDDDFFIGSPTPDLIHNADPYDILRVSPRAAQDEIRASFRNLVKLYHPDINPGDSEAAEIFKRISIAYRILGDAEKRARYDKGEIGSDGEISPEYEAKQHFRRHAFRIYTAAAASLVLAVGALVAVWYIVLTQDGGDDHKVRIAVASPPKGEERLPVTMTGPPTVMIDDEARPGADTKAGEEVGSTDADTNATPATAPSPAAIGAYADDTPAIANEGAATAETAPGPNPEAAADPVAQPAAPADDAVKDKAAAPVQEAKPDTATAEVTPDPVDAKPSPADGTRSARIREDDGDSDEDGKVPDPNIAAPHSGVEQAQPSASADPKPAGAEQSPPPTQGTTQPPLGDQHNGGEARPAQADAARSGATKSASVEDPGSVAGTKSDAERVIVAKAATGISPHSDLLLRRSMGRKIGSDPISAMFWSAAISASVAADRAQSTASVDSLVIQDASDGSDEVQDIYKHSLPESPATSAGKWPEVLKAKDRPVERRARSAARAPVPVPTEMRVENFSPPEPTPGAAFRERAVSDVLAGGL